MIDNNGNGRWQLGFWIMTILFFTWCSTLTANIISNDRIRQSSDIRIEENGRKEMEIIRERLEKNQLDIIQRLTRIETKLEEK